MDETEMEGDDLMPADGIKSIAFIANRAEAGVTTLTAMASMEAYQETGDTIAVIDVDGHGWLQRWRRQAMWRPDVGLEVEWDGDDLHARRHRGTWR